MIPPKQVMLLTLIKLLKTMKNKNSIIDSKSLNSKSVDINHTNLGVTKRLIDKYKASQYIDSRMTRANTHEKREAS